ncbi:MAG: alkyl hydroperoxide reductase subunit C [Defluviitaleaceae bacterium]|nr:alkyl hydroperoxide reductase subunit C [Defluviitaleaceae bacterium]
MSLIGKKLETFKTDAFKKGEFITVDSAKDFAGKWVVVVFYPADFTFVCPTELEDLQDQLMTLSQLGVEVYSCSTDTHFVHAAWHQHSEAIGKVEYTMLADPAQKISRIFDVLDEESGLAQRGSFIIDPEGIVQVVEITADGIGRNAAHLVDKIKMAQYVRNNPGEVCPAKWKEGAEALKPSLDLVGKI